MKRSAFARQHTRGIGETPMPLLFAAPNEGVSPNRISVPIQLQKRADGGALAQAVGK
ncbi:hypothetical protein [Candidatus Rhodobacter oscarellae]|uniref:hypothetical protein n=1 Tax=Candidatus Rhodobacter oscarellae TaxID=1675527 RepID=UPI001364D760|nr:hypothetical protein [Candidatus Rhodobacter lobularis]